MYNITCSTYGINTQTEVVHLQGDEEVDVDLLVSAKGLKQATNVKCELTYM